MAATPFEAIHTTPFLFDIYNDESPAPRDFPGLQLPGGPCNFVDLRPGASGVKCGCRRFWSRHASTAALAAGLDSDHLLYCMCSHHACFHDDTAAGPSLSSSRPEMSSGQENEKPRGNREPLSPVQGLSSFQIPPDFGEIPATELTAMDFTSFSTHGAAVQNALPQAEKADFAGPGSSMPDTLSWGIQAQSQSGHTTLPPIPSQCLLPSQSGSTNTASQLRYLRPFAGKGLQTLSGTSLGQVRDALRDQAEHRVMLDDIIPEIASSNQPSANMPPVDDGAPTPMAQTTQDLLYGLAADSPLDDIRQQAFHQLSDTVSSHEQRLDKLESASFSVAGHEDCQDKHDHTDIRVTELESRVEEVEKRLYDDNGSLASSRRAITDVGDVMNSEKSVSLSGSGCNSARTDLYSQLEALQAQIRELQATSPPSYNRPWELEVVFLPFPLRGIWMKLGDFAPLQRLPGNDGPDFDDWTQIPNTHSRATPDPQSPFNAEWAAPGSEWLLPRACAPGRMIDQRLRSRGLIKTACVRGCDARSVQLAVNDALGTILRAMPLSPESLSQRPTYTSDPRVSKFLGLHQPWIPLRKLHKDSRLRFLSPAEMLTPAIWDTAFLMSTVVMKASGMQRLYLTQPEAYLQDPDALSHPPNDLGWSWQKLRELSRVYPDSQSSTGSTDVPEADALESYWTWNDRLDGQPSTQSLSLWHRQPQQSHISRAPDEPSRDPFPSAQSPILSASPIYEKGQSPAISRERKCSRPAPIRTTSLPPGLPATVSPPMARNRPVASNNVAGVNALAHAANERRPSPFLATRSSPRMPLSLSSIAIISKQRRRSTRSPSLRPRNTPRWSNRSLSRSPSLAPAGGPTLLIEDERGERRTTPFCYATPYSNAPPDHQLHGQHARHIVAADEVSRDVLLEDGDRGNLTDLYDGNSEIMSHETCPLDRYRDANNSSEVDIPVYEDDAGHLNEVGAGSEDPDSQQLPRSYYARQQSWHVESAVTLPEDEPWPGIEDDMSDGENMDPLDTDMDGSDSGSEPSEYPSTQRAWHVVDDDNMDDPGSNTGFKIHEDGIETGVRGSVTRWN